MTVHASPYGRGLGRGVRLPAWDISPLPADKIRAAPLVSSEGKILQMLDLKDILEMIATCYEKVPSAPAAPHRTLDQR